ncbi:hypothetical protein FISHEDRAFT_53506 [Fistulina hepatica ATCC 64428]|nr:hypothetical protein FISHEDRAFT_53506 [Fistulina hepatica ATCC 64428]
MVERSRSRSGEREAHSHRHSRRRHSHSRSRSPRRRARSPRRSRSLISLPHQARPISEADYFRKSDEFRLWLRDEKDRYFDELSGEKARSYFRKFVKRWNKGKLPDEFYAGIDTSTIDAQSQTSYKWSFADKKTKADEEAIRAVREEVGTAARVRSAVSPSDSQSKGPVAGPSSGRLHGPTLPSSADLAFARENEAESMKQDRKYDLRRDRKEAKDRIEDMVGPREVGREGMLEKRAHLREENRAYRERGDDGFEANESTLYGGGDSFKERIARRDASRRKYEQAREGKTMETRERANQMREKERSTMDMFMKLAQERFGR